MTTLAVRPRQRSRTLAVFGQRLATTFADMKTELLSTLFYMLGNHEDAQDAYQETFLKCWRARGRLGKVQNLRAWIFRIGLNAAKDLQRNAWRRKSRPLIGIQPVNDRAESSPPEVVVDREALERVRGALMNLRRDEKEVFLLRQNGSLTYEEIADLRRRPVGTVKTQMRTALIKLRQVLQEKPGSG